MYQTHPFRVHLLVAAVVHDDFSFASFYHHLVLQYDVFLRVRLRRRLLFR